MKDVKIISLLLLQRKFKKARWQKSGSTAASLRIVETAGHSSRLLLTGSFLGSQEVQDAGGRVTVSYPLQLDS